MDDAVIKKEKDSYGRRRHMDDDVIWTTTSEKYDEHMAPYSKSLGEELLARKTKKNET
jgi:hypothetical protein